VVFMSAAVVVLVASPLTFFPDARPSEPEPLNFGGDLARRDLVPMGLATRGAQ